jgi:catechol 2,3-dioxygenase-like lactoylglutathione lyase family enzyme
LLWLLVRLTGVTLSVIIWAALGVVFAGEPLVRAVGPIGITVSDTDRSVAFYRDVLSFEPVSDVEVTGEAYEHLTGVFGLRMRVVRMHLGDEQIELIEYLTPRGRPIPVDSRSNDRWFQHIAMITGDMDKAFAWLRAHKVQMSSPAPQTLPAWNQAAGGIRAFYFKDPDGNNLEVLQFPDGKGLAKWHVAADRLFLGIDHTAIVVADTEASLALYRDRLGLTVAGEADNYGPEQERLNNVFGAHLRITALRAASGPGIEFLEYLTPRDGRPAPADTHANDLWHWQVDLVTADVAAAGSVLREGRYAEVSPGPVALPEAELGIHEGLMARDPDGHGLLFVEP